jgi:hypothetical protein
MAYIKFKDPKEPSIKSMKPIGKKWRTRFYILLAIFIIEQGYLIYKLCQFQN